MTAQWTVSQGGGWEFAQKVSFVFLNVVAAWDEKHFLVTVPEGFHFQKNRLVTFLFISLKVIYFFYLGNMVIFFKVDLFI